MNGSYTPSGIPPPIIFPPNLNIGDTWAFNVAAGDYANPSANGPWTATMTFASGPTRLASPATLSTNVFYWLISKTDTKTLPSGTLVFTVSVTDTVDRYTLQEGTVQALPDVQDPSVSVPTQTMLQQLLTACDATLLQLLSQRTSSVVFAGKAYTLWDVAKLWAVRSDLAQRAADELAAAAGNAKHRIIIPVFKNPWAGPYPSWPYYPFGW